MSSGDDVPRPPAPEPPALLQWLQRGRSDPRLAIAVVALVAIAAGVALWRAGRPDSAPAAGAVAAAEPVVPTSATSVASVTVHVVGAVLAPGVVRLAAGARVLDAVDAAGGASDDADVQRLNLAALVADGQRIAVPRLGEPDPPPPIGGAENAGTGAAAGPLDLNTATPAQLEALPGIGPALAQAIVGERERSGGFRKVDDLQRVRGIGEARLAQLRELVTVSG
jgi:competence protein ComEA